MERALNESMDLTAAVHQDSLGIDVKKVGNNCVCYLCCYHINPHNFVLELFRVFVTFIELDIISKSKKIFLSG